ncbi:capsid assembly protein [Pseudomonas phage Stalingrad]|uniref:Capsid assembly protein n=1 Tax=Pseudomonas phage Stalingrad TaxID=2762287 RepID=A0A7G8LJ51_9CAUD|nr:capsid assembly protein [Pseudomonas phage Stalingrad]
MSGESQASVYASFGVQSMVLSGENIEEHRQAMLEEDVAVRDGDDQIVLNPESDNVTVKDLVEDPYGQEDRTEITIPTEGDLETEVDNDAQEGSEGEGEGEQEGGEEQPGEVGDQLGEPSDELTKASQEIKEYADGFAQMRAQAVSNGLSEEMAAQVEKEYENDGQLSEASLEALKAAGFSPAFVKSFIQGQEAMATAYVNSIVEYAGGKAQWDVLIGHLQSNSPDTVEVLEAAIQRQDLAAIRATINLAKTSHKAKFGKAPARTITKAAPATKQGKEPVKVEGFKSQDEMVKAMSDRRYGTDSAYRNEVRRKVEASNW